MYVHTKCTFFPRNEETLHCPNNSTASNVESSISKIPLNNIVPGEIEKDEKKLYITSDLYLSSNLLKKLWYLTSIVIKKLIKCVELKRSGTIMS